MHLTFGVPVVSRVSNDGAPPGDPSKSTLDLEKTRFVSGMPLGVMRGSNAHVFTHVDFVVWFSPAVFTLQGEIPRTVHVLGVEAIPRVDSLINLSSHCPEREQAKEQGKKKVQIGGGEEETKDVICRLDDSYSVVWKMADYPMSSLFPQWSHVSHAEWGPIVRTIAAVIAGIATVISGASVTSGWCRERLSRAQRHLTASATDRHMLETPLHLPSHFVALYAVVGVAVFTVTTVGMLASLPLLLSNLICPLFSPSSSSSSSFSSTSLSSSSTSHCSGPIYRITLLVTPISFPLMALVAGYVALPLTDFLVKKLGPRFSATFMLALSALFGWTCVALSAWTMQTSSTSSLQQMGLWLEIEYVLIGIALVLVCVFCMWLGAWIGYKRRRPTQGMTF